MVQEPAGRQDIRSPLVVGIGGIGVHSALMLKEDSGADILLLDTDRRSFTSGGAAEYLLVGEKLSNGEGCGGNLNSAKAAFKMDIERIAPAVLGRPLVITLASATGATGIAGTVEVSQLLSKVGAPAFSIFIKGGGLSDPGPVPMAALLLKGPVRPGAVFDMEGKEEKELYRMLGLLIRGALPAGEFAIPTAAWGILREHGSAFQMVKLDFSGARAYLELDRPALISLTIKSDVPIEEIRSTIDTKFGQTDGLMIGIVMEDDVSEMDGCALVPSKNYQGAGAPDLAPGRDQLRDLAGSGIEESLEPGRSIQNGPD